MSRSDDAGSPTPNHGRIRMERGSFKRVYNTNLNMHDDIFLQFMFLGKFSVFLNKSIDTINHLLYQLNFGISQSVLVGDIICNT